MQTMGKISVNNPSLSAILILLVCLYNTVAYGQASVVTGSVSNSKTNYSPGVGNNRLIVVAVSNGRVVRTVRVVIR